ncbi:MAG: hypothetical protein WCD80_10745 [Desulfobaccales bacterium]
MRKIFICIGAISWLLFGCAQFHSSEEIVYENGKLQKFSYSNDSQKSDSAGFMDALDVLRRADPAALPQLADLPRFQRDQKTRAATYTGVIKNSTRYDVSVPSLNSDATLQIPAHGWIEYRAYTKNFELTVYSDGKPFYCLKILADPRNYQYACKKYDFIAEIVKPEPVQRYKPLKKRRHFKKRPPAEGEGLG